MSRFWSILLICVVLVIVIFLVYIYSGIYNVSAQKDHTGFVKWVLNTTMEESVKHHAKGIVVPDLSDSSMVKEGAFRYSRMCSGCHGAPGKPQGGHAKNFNPPPPELVKVVDEWTPGELFWITRNGIKMSAMPARGSEVSDEEIWNIVAFMKQMSNISGDQYKAMTETGEADQH
jgi:mono/diheme cytochrome c family protein